MSEREISFDAAFKEAGGVRRRAPVPYPLTHESIRRMAEKKERLLRIQLEDERFDDDDERQLASLSLDDPDQAFERYQYIVGLWYAWQKGLRASGAAATDRDVARWMLLAREPRAVRVAGRIVQITSRSRGAMIRMARHEAARELLAEKIDLINERTAAIDEQRQARAIGWLRAIARKRRLHALRARCETEWEHHFRGILANALTPDGRAALPEEAPEWWSQVTQDDEVRIQLALFDVGPVRMDLGKKPPQPQKASDRKQQPMTFGDLLRYWEPKLKLPPMALEDRDLAQMLVAWEDGAADGAGEDAVMEALS